MRTTTNIPASAPDAQALAALGKTRGFSTDRLRLTLKLKGMLLAALGLALGQWRESRDPVSGEFAEHCQAEIQRDRWEWAHRIVSGRLGRMAPAQRKRYTPEERFEIVMFVRTYGDTLDRAAAIFMVDPHTISRWIGEAEAEPDKKTVGSLLKATPPLRSIRDVTRSLVTLLDRMGVGGSLRIAQMLTRAGRPISDEAVRTIRRKPKTIAPSPEPSKRKVSPALTAKGPNHIWMTDITNVPSFLNLWILKLVVILDVYSRFPLAFRVFWSEPTSEQIATLVEEASKKHGPPAHFITDQGTQFTGGPFAGLMKQMNVRQRFGAIGRSGSIAIIERFWRTLKETLDLEKRPPLSAGHLEDRVALFLIHYAHYRPHQGLAGATPAERYKELKPSIEQASTLPTPTARPPDHGELPLEVIYLDPERRLPILVPATIAA